MNLKLNMVPNAETIDKQRELFELNPAANDAPGGDDGKTPPDPLVSFGKRTIPLGKSRLIKDPLAIEDAMLEERHKGERSFGGLFFSLLVVAVVAMHLLFAWILDKRQDTVGEAATIRPAVPAPVENRVSSSSTMPSARPLPVPPATPSAAPPVGMAPLPAAAAPKPAASQPATAQPAPSPIHDILKGRPASEAQPAPAAAGGQPPAQPAPVEKERLLNILNQR